MLHGAGSNSAVWRGDMLVLSRTHRVFAVDGSENQQKRSQSAEMGFTRLCRLDDRYTRRPRHRARPRSAASHKAAGRRCSNLPSRHRSGIEQSSCFAPTAASWLTRYRFATRGAAACSRSMGCTAHDAHPVWRSTVPDGVEEITTMVTSNFNARRGAAVQ